MLYIKRDTDSGRTSITTAIDFQGKNIALNLPNWEKSRPNAGQSKIKCSNLAPRALRNSVLKSKKCSKSAQGIDRDLLVDRARFFAFVSRNFKQKRDSATIINQKRVNWKPSQQGIRDTNLDVCTSPSSIGDLFGSNFRRPWKTCGQGGQGLSAWRELSIQPIGL